MSVQTATAPHTAPPAVRLTHAMDPGTPRRTCAAPVNPQNSRCINAYGIHRAHFDGSGGRRLHRMRLTARGRVLLIGVGLIMVLIGLGVVGALRAEAAGEPAAPAPAGWHMIVVQPHDTLWGIARDVAPGADPRVLIEDMRSVNDLSGSALQVGDRLWVPATSS